MLGDDVLLDLVGTAVNRCLAEIEVGQGGLGLAAFPDALVLLSRRPLDRWYDSASETIFPDRPVDESDAAAVARTRMWHAIRANFSPDVHDREITIEAARRHNEAVIAETPADRLLIYEPGDGWEPICERLELPIPDTPFPHVNTREQFLGRVAEHEAEPDGG